MIRYSLITILFSLLLASCGDNKKDSVIEDPIIENSLIGTWESDCVADEGDQWLIETIKVTDEAVTLYQTFYPTSSCQNESEEVSQLVTYSLGEQSTAGITNIDIMIPGTDDIILDIFKIEAGVLYFGDDIDEDDSTRPTDIDYGNPFQFLSDV